MEKKTKLLVVLSAMTVMAILVANLTATKLWNLPLFNIAVDGGLIVFPITYLVGDIVVEFYGRKTADQIVWMAMIFNLVATVMLIIVGQLPAYPGWEGQEAYMAILGTAAPRNTAASLIAYVASGLMNNLVFEKIRNWQKQKSIKKSERTAAEIYDQCKTTDKDEIRSMLIGLEEDNDRSVGYVIRAIGSSIVGRLIDNILFEMIAFIGVLPFVDFIWQTVGAFVEGLIIEFLLAVFVSKFIVKAIHKWLD